MPNGRPGGERTGGRSLRVSRPDKPARDLDPRRLGFRLADQAGRPVTLNLIELITVDGEVAPGPPLPIPIRKRPQHGEDRHRGHQREQEQ